MSALRRRGGVGGRAVDEAAAEMGKGQWRRPLPTMLGNLSFILKAMENGRQGGDKIRFALQKENWLLYVKRIQSRSILPSLGVGFLLNELL